MSFKKVERYLSENYCLRRNVLNHTIEIKGCDEEEFSKLNENTLFRTLKNNKVSITMNNLLVLLKSDFVQEFNPLFVYFESLPAYNPMNEVDYINDLSKYVHCKEKERWQLNFKKALVRAIACGLNPHFFNKQAIILMGMNQNIGKTTFIRYLTPQCLKDYETQGMGTSKDDLIKLTTTWMINLDEIDEYSKMDLNALKAVLSTERVNIRKPYDRVSTSNKLDFLTDPTGNVRWICFEIDFIDFNYLTEINIDKVWGQAWHLFNNGFKYSLSKEEVYQNEISNKLNIKITVEIEMIQKYIIKGGDNDVFATATDILKILQNLEPLLCSHLTVERIGKALTTLGFERGQMVTKDKVYQSKGYYIKNTPT
jgi:predicted P-loop ATPase